MAGSDERRRENPSAGAFSQRATRHAQFATRYPPPATRYPPVAAVTAVTAGPVRRQRAYQLIM